MSKNKKNDAATTANTNETHINTTQEGENTMNTQENTTTETAEVNETVGNTTTEETKTSTVMAGTCSHCGKDHATANQCDHGMIKISGAWHERVGVESKSGARCDSCGINWNKGNIHHYGCANEVCPVCGLKITECACAKQEVALLLRVKRLIKETTTLLVPARVASAEIEDFIRSNGFKSVENLVNDDEIYTADEKIQDFGKKLKREFGKVAEKITVTVA